MDDNIYIYFLNELAHFVYLDWQKIKNKNIYIHIYTYEVYLLLDSYVFLFLGPHLA